MDSAGERYAPGDRLAERYQLIRVLDRGAMGVVWIAHHLALDVHVALKLLRPDAGSEEAARRLVREAQAAARLDHPAILRVLDVGTTAAGDPFLVMELLEGECFADVLVRERRLDPVTAVRTILPITDALVALHAKGIVHRDVKPENIFLAQSDSGRWQPKLIDFGVVKLEGPTVVNPITQRGAAVGTLNYMSPEQIQGADADAGADLWALSVVLYEALTGEPPFHRETLTRLITEVFANRPRPLADHGVPEPELWKIVQRGLAPRAGRWPSARALGEALAGWLRARGVTQDIVGVALPPGRPDEEGAPEATSDASAPAVEVPAESRAGRSLQATTLPSFVPPAAAPEPSRRRLALGLAAVAVGAGLLAATWLTSRPPVAAAAPEPPAATADPAPRSEPATTAPPATASATAPAQSASATPRRPSRPRAPALPPGLKDPFR